MELFDALLTRRSIRNYQPQQQPITDDMLRIMLEAAMSAPSAGTQQPWQFIVISDRDKLDSVPEFHPYCTMIREVALAVLVCGDPQGKRFPDFWIQDCSAAAQNFLLAARGLGLGTVWTGVFPEESRIKGCRALFDLPEQIIPFAIIPVGWPQGKFVRMKRYNPDLVHQNSWTSP